MNAKDFFVLTEEKNAKIELCVFQKNDFGLILKLTADFKEKISPKAVTVQWKIPMGEIVSIWSPLARFSRYILPDWAPSKSNSRGANGSPVLSLINQNGTNAQTVALSDAKTPTFISAGSSEEDGVFVCNAVFFTGYIAPISHYEAYIYIDFEQKSFADAIRGVNQWWEEAFGYTKAYVPKEAYLPMDSAWYSFHQELDSQALLEQCKLSSSLGMKTLIIDDGWQTADNNRGYQYCGDWELATQKIADMKALVDKIHQLGMKVMLWFSVPFVGIGSKAYEQYKNLALREYSDGVLVVDIRYKEVRDHLVAIYASTVQNWGLDGLKLDFIDCFALTKDSSPANDKMDIWDIEAALEALLSQVKTELLRINPEILLEFRQPYIGPMVLKYGNMIRVGDCPFDSIRNRVGIIDLRLTSGKTAVHSDMIIWSQEASAEAVARQLISTLFGVPQVSVRLNELPKDHHTVIRFWLDFYTRNKDILHSENMQVKNPEIGYTQVRVYKENESIGVNYANVPFELSSHKCGTGFTHTFINSSNDPYVTVTVLENMESCRVQSFDCMGRLLNDQNNSIGIGIHMFEVPICGFIKISK